MPQTLLGLNYKDKVLKIHPESLIAYYPLNEQEGTVAYDLSSQANNDTYVSVANLAHGYGPDSVRCPLFDGTADYVDIYSAAFNTDFSTATGSAMIWVRPLNSGVHTAATRYGALAIGADTSNIVYLEHTTTASTYRIAYIAGGTTKSVTAAYLDIANYDMDWVQLGITWDTGNDAMVAYLNGAQTGTTQSSLGTWSGSLASTLCVLGAINTTPDNAWSGWLAHAAVWSSVLSADDFARLYKVGEGV